VDYLGWQAASLWAGRQIPNVLFNLYLIATKIEYKKINIFYSDPLPDLRPDLETSGYSAFTYMFGFPKFQITTELWCLVVWSAQGLDYHSKISKYPNIRSANPLVR
jgi:hypothetical protein